MVFGFSPYGHLGSLVQVEVDIRRGLPGTDIVGLPGHEVREARERVRVAIRNAGFQYPADRILISLSPAAVPKSGAGLDLALALAILSSSRQIELPFPCVACGELRLDGGIIPVRGAVAGAIAAMERGVSTAIVPRVSAARVGATGIKKVYPLDRIDQLITGELVAWVPAGPGLDPGLSGPESALSFDDMIGQPRVKRACCIAAAGGHNVLLMGPPGTGKTMAALRLCSLLPDLTRRKALETARIHSTADVRRGDAHISRRPPVRVPHHGASPEGLVGGGRNARPGEVSLAHNGVLIIDEAAEFGSRALQALREPVENHAVTISRAHCLARVPADFQLVMTNNLCPCGQFGASAGQCLCSIQDIGRYWRRIGAALLDRIEVRVRTARVLNGGPDGGNEATRRGPAAAVMREGVTIARNRQIQRYRDERDGRSSRSDASGAVDEMPVLNGRVPTATLLKTIRLSASLERMLQSYLQRHGLSDRAAIAVRAVARTIADLDDREDIAEQDLAEAVSLRAAGDIQKLGMVGG